MVAKTILAVAIGSPVNYTIKTATDPNIKKARPYIRGLIDWLANQNDPPKPKGLRQFKIGDANDYIINYRECREADLATLFNTFGAAANLIFCMSTSVAKAAAAYTNAAQSTTPIVAIVSDPKRETTFGTNVCGVSAKRSQTARDCFDQFRDSAPDLQKIYVLHKAGYGPSEDANYWLDEDDDVISVPIQAGDDIKTKILGLPASSGGVLVLPADRFFGAAAEIITNAQKTQKLPTFWSTTDLVDGTVNGAFGGYGIPQLISGQFMAQRVAYIWTNGAIPKPRFITIRNKWFDLKTNPAVAKELKIKLATTERSKK